MALNGTDFNLAYFGSDTMEPAPQDTQPTLPQPKLQQKTTTPYYDTNVNTNSTATDAQLTALTRELVKQKAKAQNTPSIVARYVHKKKEIIKLVVMALVVLLALSAHNFIDHYLMNYIRQADLTQRKEMLTRLGYPVSVLLSIWSAKVFF